LANQAGVCTIVNTSCCMYINQTQRVNTHLQSIWDQTEVLHQITQDDTWGFRELWNNLTYWLPKLTWLKQLFMIVVMLIVLGIKICFGVWCFIWINTHINDGCEEWKRHQLRWKMESGRYFQRT
ncbi:ERVV1 protein, partial [Sapayoa aenigma]|nr:ERVV1 protein [Sapayoa aenigma]